MEMINWVMENWEQVLMGVSSIVGGFSVLATMTPNSADNKVVDMVMRVVNFLGANVGKAKNA
jgi:hypothetical protein|tara:strand:- start:352 stop:537 length:186 start_codon:yes stop_codon:yes gene_type:complete